MSVLETLGAVDDREERCRNNEAHPRGRGAELYERFSSGDRLQLVVDVRQRAVVRTIALASGAQPFSIAVNDVGSVAVVAERGRA